MSGLLISYMSCVYYAVYVLCDWQSVYGKKSTRFRGCLGYQKVLMYEFTHSLISDIEPNDHSDCVSAHRPLGTMQITRHIQQLFLGLDHRISQGEGKP